MHRPAASPLRRSDRSNGVGNAATSGDPMIRVIGNSSGSSDPIGWRSTVMTFELGILVPEGDCLGDACAANERIEGVARASPSAAGTSDSLSPTPGSRPSGPMMATSTEPMTAVATMTISAIAARRLRRAPEPLFDRLWASPRLNWCDADNWPRAVGRRAGLQGSWSHRRTGRGTAEGLGGSRRGRYRDGRHTRRARSDTRRPCCGRRCMDLGGEEDGDPVGRAYRYGDINGDGRDRNRRKPRHRCSTRGHGGTARDVLLVIIRQERCESPAGIGNALASAIANDRPARSPARRAPPRARRRARPLRKG